MKYGPADHTEYKKVEHSSHTKKAYDGCSLLCQENLVQTSIRKHTIIFTKPCSGQHLHLESIQNMQHMEIFRYTKCLMIIAGYNIISLITLKQIMMHKKVHTKGV